jgi:hypothetical protein
MVKLEKWCTYAELASKEEDPSKLMELAEKLRLALDRELLGRVPRPASRDVVAPQETT